MTQNTGAQLAPVREPRSSDRLHLDRLVIGLLTVIAGIGWLLDNLGLSVPWRMFPAVGLVVVGLALIATVGGAGRGGLVGLGAVLLVLALVVGVGNGRFVGPVGDRVVAPRVSDWPVDTQLAAGTLTIDLTRYPLPAQGDLRADVGAGRIVVILPSQGSVGIDAEVGMGEVKIDGRQQQGGIGVRWRTPGAADLTLDLQVGTGSVEVDHE